MLNKKLKLTKTNTLGYILILVGLLFVTIPLIRRSYKDYSARMAEKEFRQIQENRNKEEGYASLYWTT